AAASPAGFAAILGAAGAGCDRNTPMLSRALAPSAGALDWGATLFSAAPGNARGAAAPAKASVSGRSAGRCCLCDGVDPAPCSSRLKPTPEPGDEGFKPTPEWSSLPEVRLRGTSGFADVSLRGSTFGAENGSGCGCRTSGACSCIRVTTVTDNTTTAA